MKNAAANQAQALDVDANVEDNNNNSNNNNNNNSAAQTANANSGGSAGASASQQQKKKGWNGWTPEEDALYLKALRAATKNVKKNCAPAKLLTAVAKAVKTKNYQQVRDRYYRCLKQVNMLLSSCVPPCDPLDTTKHAEASAAVIALLHCQSLGWTSRRLPNGGPKDRTLQVVVEAIQLAVKRKRETPRGNAAKKRRSSTSVGAGGAGGSQQAKDDGKDGRTAKRRKKSAAATLEAATDTATAINASDEAAAPAPLMAGLAADGAAGACEDGARAPSPGLLATAPPATTQSHGTRPQAGADATTPVVGHAVQKESPPGARIALRLVTNDAATNAAMQAANLCPKLQLNGVRPRRSLRSVMARLREKWSVALTHAKIVLEARDGRRITENAASSTTASELGGGCDGIVVVEYAFNVDNVSAPPTSPPTSPSPCPNGTGGDEYAPFVPGLFGSGTSPPQPQPPPAPPSGATHTLFGGLTVPFTQLNGALSADAEEHGLGSLLGAGF
ncbi:hypothetical protein PPROV_000144800 [Pycnococcus provasolii]|uniref:Myb-like domain-containing protein n=1 Tax=Pycnococcus provasolii TaxID=41880 RepID=A0A830H8L6_9CHLO|nr:hypothetical protein PPROV_000144800 [Pycnococcus provasolii]